MTLAFNVLSLIYYLIIAFITGVLTKGILILREIEIPFTHWVEEKLISMIQESINKIENIRNPTLEELNKLNELEGKLRVVKTFFEELQAKDNIAEQHAQNEAKKELSKESVSYAKIFFVFYLIVFLINGYALTVQPLVILKVFHFIIMIISLVLIKIFLTVRMPENIDGNLNRRPHPSDPHRMHNLMKLDHVYFFCLGLLVVLCSAASTGVVYSFFMMFYS